MNFYVEGESKVVKHGIVNAKMRNLSLSFKKVSVFTFAFLGLALFSPNGFARVEHCSHLPRPDSFDALINSGTRVFCHSTIRALGNETTSSEAALRQEGREFQVLLYRAEDLTRAEAESWPYLRLLAYENGHVRAIGTLTYGETTQTLSHLNDYNIELKRALLTGLESYGFWPRGWSVPALMTTYVFHDVLFGLLGHFEALRLPTATRAIAELLAEDTARIAHRFRLDGRSTSWLNRMRANWNEFMRRNPRVTNVDFAALPTVPLQLPDVAQAGEVRRSFREIYIAWRERAFGRVARFLSPPNTAPANVSAFIKLGLLSLLISRVYSPVYSHSMHWFNNLDLLRNYRARYANRLDGFFTTLPQCLENVRFCDNLDHRVLIVDHVSPPPLTQDGRNVGRGAHDEAAARFLTVLRDMFSVSDHGAPRVATAATPAAAPGTGAAPAAPAPVAAPAPSPATAAPVAVAAVAQEVVRQPLRLVGYEEFTGALDALFRPACDTFEFATVDDVEEHCARTVGQNDVGFRWVSASPRTSTGRGGLR